MVVTGKPLADGVDRMDWTTLQDTAAACQACDLCGQRKKSVFGVGDVQADWMFIGDPPGEDEEQQGEPFAGQAGQLLDNMLKAVGLARQAHGEGGVYITNAVKCRPPGRNPTLQELSTCAPYLARQVALVQPKVIVVMGRFAVQSVLQSTQYAHYTSAPVVNAIWSAVGHMGFTGGKIMEPGMGIGTFPMLMPDAVRATSKYTGIEFDGPTALIAKLLSPEQHMLHDDFIKRKFPRDFFDVAIGNPPFSQTRIFGDPDYEKYKFMLHDFFFAKSLDRVRPGGLLVFVTSKGTMDKLDDKARSFLAERADLVGAVHLLDGKAAAKLEDAVRDRDVAEAAAGLEIGRAHV